VLCAIRDYLPLPTVGLLCVSTAKPCCKLVREAEDQRKVVTLFYFDCEFITTIAVCLPFAAAAVLIYLPFVVVAYARMRVGLNLAAPTMFDKLPPYAQRANWAHQNSLEAFMILRQRR